MNILLGKKRVINIIELIIQGFLLISIFSVQSIEIVSHSYNSTTTTKTSLIGYAAINGMNFLYLIPIALMLLNTILCLVSIFGNSSDKDGKVHIGIPIANLIYSFWFINAISDYINATYKTFWIICLILITILAILKRTSLVVPKVEAQPQQIINNIQKTSNADELKKFKDLLDNGVITEKEFDEKKKELLGL